MTTRRLEEACAHPEVFRTRIPAAPGPRWRLAAGLDLGTSCGVAFAHYREGEPFDLERSPVVLGRWSLGAASFESGALRFAKLYQFLSELQPDLLAAEEPKYSPPAGMNPRLLLARCATASEFLGGLKTAAALWAEHADVPFKLYQIGTIKKFATGKGSANKVEMIEAVNTRLGARVLEPEGYENSGHDNVADAFWVLMLGLGELAQGAAFHATVKGDNRETRPGPTRTRKRANTPADGAGS